MKGAAADVSMQQRAAAADLVARGSQLLQAEHAQQEILVIGQGIRMAGEKGQHGQYLRWHTLSKLKIG